MASRLWKFLTTDIHELATLDTVNETSDAAEALLGLAKALATEGPKVQQLAPFVTQLDSLLDVLNSPLEKVVGPSLPFVSIGTGLLKFYRETTNQEPTIAQSVALVSQAAYLATVNAFLGHPKLKTWLTKVGNKPASELVAQQLKTIATIELEDTEARRALLYFHQSKLAAVYGDVLMARLRGLGVKPNQASRLAERLAKETTRIMLHALVKSSNSVNALVDWYRTGDDEVFETYLSIDTYLEEWIAPRPHESVFAENFSFKDSYVSLKAQPLTAAGEIDHTKEPVVLDQCAQQILDDDSYKDQVLFIQGEPGRGKSVFCRIFADWVRQHAHPRWTPILIRLRDVSVVSKDFEETLAKAVDRDFSKTDSGWLTDRNVRFVFLLDGFDELLIEEHTSGGLDSFLEQVGQFQAQCARDPDKGHRVVITGRTAALKTIERRLPSNLARVDIAPMDEQLQKEWVDRWSTLTRNTSDKKSHLKEFLQNKVSLELVREPLLLYLLAAMDRQGELQPDMFEGTTAAKAKALIYEHTLDWMLTKQRPANYRKDAHNLAKGIDLHPDITELAPHSLRHILQAAGLCVVQSGIEFGDIKAIEARLLHGSSEKAFLKTVRKQLATDNTPWRNALTTFSLPAGHPGEGSIEFVHQSFGEFLCAERIVNGLIEVCQPGDNREYGIDDTAFCWAIYDLLGCQVLKPEIVEYLTALLIKHPKLDAKRLCKRLYDFYWQWSEGVFIDAAPENLPQQIMRLLWQRIPNRQGQLGQRQVDMYAGLNVMILLLEFHRYGLSLMDSHGEGDSANSTDISQSNSLGFYPNGSDDRPFSENKLRQIIGVSHCIGLEAFRQYVGPFFRSADLSDADLRSINLSQADLSQADLSRANLGGAVLDRANLSRATLNKTDLSRADLRNTDLNGADLSRADLRRADLRSANLSNADLRSANLRRADLSRANLSGTLLRSAALSGTNLSRADLSNANLSSADFSDADLSNVNVKGAIFSDQHGVVQWNKHTNWNGIREIDSAIGVPERVKQQLDLTD